MKAKTLLKIDWATHKAAKYACLHWHYSKSMPVPPLFKLGAWESDKFIGAVIFSRGASSKLMKPYGLEIDQGCELTRVALTAHVNPVTRIISVCIRFLKKHNPGLKLIVSFADPYHDHHGGIYQGGNWIYTGQSNASIQYIDKTGRKFHPRQVSVKGYNIQQGDIRKTVKKKDCTKIKMPGKHRYLMPLCDEIRPKIEKLRQPFPKACKVGDDSDQENSGGAAPTYTLHNCPK